jgi:hypothetical protein
MYLVMIINRAEIARKQFLSSDKLSVMIAEMKRKFKDKIPRGEEPQFYLVNVPSVMNSFVRLNGRA